MMKKKDGTRTESDSLERLSNDRKMTLYSNLKAGYRWVFTRYTNHWHTLPNLLLWEIQQFAENSKSEMSSSWLPVYGVLPTSYASHNEILHTHFIFNLLYT